MVPCFDVRALQDISTVKLPGADAGRSGIIHGEAHVQNSCTGLIKTHLKSGAKHSERLSWLLLLLRHFNLASLVLGPDMAKGYLCPTWPGSLASVGFHTKAKMI